MRTVKNFKEVFYRGCGCNWKPRVCNYGRICLGFLNDHRQPFTFLPHIKLACGSTFSACSAKSRICKDGPQEKELTNRSSVVRGGIYRTFTSSALLCSKPTTPEAKESIVNPFELAERDVVYLEKQIKEELKTSIEPLQDCSYYYFDGQGKYIRPTTLFLAARACNIHQEQRSFVNEGQRKVAMITEMIHTASLLHDDVIDEATARRNKPSVNKVWSDKQAVLAGDYILSRASIALARIGNVQVVELLAYVIENLVKVITRIIIACEVPSGGNGELMQLMSKDDVDQRFNDYLTKTFKKTASLIAYGCKAVALLGGCNEVVQSISYNFGKHLGIAFQLVDDALDFTSTSSDLGKPAAADLKLGLATAPVLFAAEKFPDLNALVMRRFRESGDIEKAFAYVRESDGVEQTILLASKYAEEAVKIIKGLNSSKERDALTSLANFVIKRKK